MPYYTNVFGCSRCKGECFQVQRSATAYQSRRGSGKVNTIGTGQYIKGRSAYIPAIESDLHACNSGGVCQAELDPLPIAVGRPAGTEIIVQHVGRHIAIIT